MTQPAQTRLDKFRKGDSQARLAQLLNDPVMVEALAIIEEKTEPNDSVIPLIVKDHGAQASFAISMIHAAQAGQRRVLRSLRNLAHKPAGEASHLDAFNAEPFSHIDESYLEQK
jgi:hypothetical protein